MFAHIVRHFQDNHTYILQMVEIWERCESTRNLMFCQMLDRLWNDHSKPSCALNNTISC